MLLHAIPYKRSIYAGQNKRAHMLTKTLDGDVLIIESD